MVPSPAIHALERSGPDVDIVFTTYQSGLGHFPADKGLTLVRESPRETVEVFDHAFFDEAEAVLTRTYCKSLWEPDPEYCAWYPDKCHDCDSDGVLECRGSCISKHYFEVTDECVPNGRALFVLSSNHNDNEYECDSMAIDVSDAPPECMGEPAFGCLLSVPGHAPPGKSASGALLVVVLAAWVVVRRRAG